MIGVADDVRPDGINTKKTKCAENKPKGLKKTVAEKRTEYFIYKNSRHAGFSKIGQDENQPRTKAPMAKNVVFVSLYFSQQLLFGEDFVIFLFYFSWPLNLELVSKKSKCFFRNHFPLRQ